MVQRRIQSTTHILTDKECYDELTNSWKIDVLYRRGKSSIVIIPPSKIYGYGQELFAFISVIYNSQSCKITHRDPENQIPGRVVLDNTEFSIKENNHFDPFQMPSQFFPIKNLFSFS